MKNSLSVRLKDCERRFAGNRQKALERDGWKCQICGRNLLEKGVRFIVHHKDKKGFHKAGRNANSSLNNLVSLCNSCHIKLHNTITDKCKVDGCDRRANFGRGLCNIHYKKWWYAEQMKDPVKRAKLQDEQRKYYDKKRGDVNRRAREWRKRNPEKVLAAHRRYRQKKKEELCH